MGEFDRIAKRYPSFFDTVEKRGRLLKIFKAGINLRLYITDGGYKHRVDRRNKNQSPDVIPAPVPPIIKRPPVSKRFSDVAKKGIFISLENAYQDEDIINLIEYTLFPTHLNIRKKFTEEYIDELQKKFQFEEGALVSHGKFLVNTIFALKYGEDFKDFWKEIQVIYKFFIKKKFGKVIITTNDLEMPKINIAFVQPRFCVRARKQLMALIGTGEIGRAILFVNSDEVLNTLKEFGLPTYSLTSSDKDISEILKKEKIQIVHSHNFPDTHTVQFIRIRNSLFPSMKIVHDVHDPAYFYVTMGNIQSNQQMILDEEMRAICESDGVIFVTSTMRWFYYGKYSFDFHKSLVLYSFPLKKDIPKNVVPCTRNKKILLVYQGSLGSVHRDYTDIFNKLDNDDDVELHIYSASRVAENFKHYHGLVPLNVLVKELPKYDAGLILRGTTTDAQIRQQLGVANKLFDYISCGLPIMRNHYDSPEQDAFIIGDGIGEKFENPNWKKELQTLRNNVQKIRYKYLMDVQIRNVLRLYRQVLGRTKNEKS